MSEETLSESEPKPQRLMSIDALRGFNMLFIMGGAGLMLNIAALWPTSSFWQAFSGQMEHVEWHGLAHHDTIFPLFLFLAGAVFPFSLAKQRERGRSKAQIYRKVFTRGILLVLFGILYGNAVNFDFANLRYAGVLAHIGLAWMFAALLTIWFSTRVRAILLGVILVGYWLLIGFVPAPDSMENIPKVLTYRQEQRDDLQRELDSCRQRLENLPKREAELTEELAALEHPAEETIETPEQTRERKAQIRKVRADLREIPATQIWLPLSIAQLEKAVATIQADMDGMQRRLDGKEALDPLAFESTLVGYVDRQWMPGRLYERTFDPEGFLSLIPAIGTALLGVFTGEYLRRRREGLTENKRVLRMLAAGLVLVLIGWLWSFAFPINKKLWTSTFVLVVGGGSIMATALFYWIIDVLGYRRWSFFFMVIGMNSITVYLASRIIGFRQARDFFFLKFSQLPCFSDSMEAVILSLGGITIMWLFVYFLYRQKIFLRV